MDWNPALDSNKMYSCNRWLLPSCTQPVNISLVVKQTHTWNLNPHSIQKSVRPVYFYVQAGKHCRFRWNKSLSNGNIHSSSQINIYFLLLWDLLETKVAAEDITYRVRQERKHTQSKDILTHREIFVELS